MIYYVNVIEAFLLNTAAQAPVIVQLPQQTPDPWWKWLFQFVLGIIPVAGGVWIAVWSFERNRKSEQEQWVRDQKRAEWRELLKCTAEIQRVLRMDSMTGGERAREIADKLKSAAHELSITSAGCVFLQDFFSDKERRNHFFSFLSQADQMSESISALLTTLRQGDPELTPEERSGCLHKIRQETEQVTDRYFEFCEWLRKEAAISLGTVSDVQNVIRSPLTPAS